MIERMNLRCTESTFVNTAMYPRYNNNMVMKNKCIKNVLKMGTGGSHL
jgi:hypothetical protein